MIPEIFLISIAVTEHIYMAYDLLVRIPLMDGG